MVQYRVQAKWSRGIDVVTWGLPLNQGLTEQEAGDMAYAIRAGLRLYGFEAEVLVDTETAVE